MNSSETFNLKRPNKWQKRPATKHVSNAHSTLVSLPVGSSIYINPRLGYFLKVQKQELHDKPQTYFRFRFNFPLR